MADELKRYSQHLEELVEKRTKSLREAERLAAMGQMAATVAHDLRNPLTGITGALYYLRKKYGRTTDAKTKEMINIIENDVEYSNNMMTGLVEYSAEVKLEAVETNPRTISEKALALVRIPRKIRVHNQTKHQPKIMLDVEKMTRVSVNIIQNAVEAMPEGGELVIASRVSKGRLQILFSDTGKGIAKKAMSKIWVPFSTTKAQGMGLGLPMAKHMVKAHGGSISIRSVTGKGTTVAVRLPIKKKPKAGGTE
jgi:signal transduction histidine kinase